jgi:hypothetical protein
MATTNATNTTHTTGTTHTTDIKRALDVRSSNTLHGINPHTTGGHIIGLVWVYRSPPDKWGSRARELNWRAGERDQYEQRILDITGIHEPGVIEISSSYGGDFLKVNLSHRRRIPEIINAALQAGLCLKMQTRLQSYYTPADAPFSLEQSEHLALQRLTQTFHDFPRILESDVWYLGDERLWKTEAGREFARRLKAQFPIQAREADEPMFLLPSPLDDPAIDYPLVEPALPSSAIPKPTLEAHIIPAAESSASTPHQSSQSSQSSQSGDPSTPHTPPSPATPVVSTVSEPCMICLDTPADTMALPCNHVVVCQKCSTGLRTTPDNKICVQCRRPIDMVVWDGGHDIKS